MTKIGGVCLVTIGVWVVIELAVQFGHYGHGCTSGEGECNGCGLDAQVMPVLARGWPQLE